MRKKPSTTGTQAVPVHEEMEELFYQRTRICLWLGVVFFSLFALLDYVHARSFFPLFLFYRLSYVLIMLGLLAILQIGRAHV